VAAFATPIMTRSEDPGRTPAPVVMEPKGPTMEERLASLERERDESRESARVWEAIANNRAPAPATPKPEGDKPRNIVDDFEFGEDEEEEETPIEGDTPEAMLDELSKLGPEALAKRGFVRKSDVVKIAREEGRKAAAAAATQAVGRARQELTAEQRLMQDFPELGDKQSELYRLAAANAREVLRDDPKANPVTVLRLSARAAKAQIEATRGGEGQGGEGDDEPPARRTGRRDPDREDHIKAQHGDRGRGRSRIDTNDDADVELSQDALDLCSKFGVSPDEYKKHVAQSRPARGRR